MVLDHVRIGENPAQFDKRASCKVVVVGQDFAGQQRLGLGNEGIAFVIVVGEPGVVGQQCRSPVAHGCLAHQQQPLREQRASEIGAAGLDFDLGEEGQVLGLEPPCLQLAHDGASALDMRPRFFRTSEFQKWTDAGVMRDHLGSFLPDRDGKRDGFLTGNQRGLQLELEEHRMRMHRPVRDLNAAQPDAPAFFDASAEVIGRSDVVAPRIFRVP